MGAPNTIMISELKCKARSRKDETHENLGTLNINTWNRRYLGKVQATLHAESQLRRSVVRNNLEHFEHTQIRKLTNSNAHIHMHADNCMEKTSTSFLEFAHCFSKQSGLPWEREFVTFRTQNAPMQTHTHTQTHKYTSTFSYNCFHSNYSVYFCAFCFFRKYISTKGWPKNSQKWFCLAGKILVSLPPDCCPTVY